MVPLSTGWPGPLPNPPREPEPWSHAAFGTRGHGCTHRNSGHVRHGRHAHRRNTDYRCDSSNRANDHTRHDASSGATRADDDTANQLAHQHRRASGQRHRRCTAIGLRLAPLAPSARLSSVQAAAEPVVVGAQRRRPVGGCQPDGAQRRRRRRGLLRGGRRSRCRHGQAFRRTSNDLRAGRATR